MKWVPVRGNRRQLPQKKRSASRLVMPASAVFLEARQEAICMHLPSERLDAGSSRLGHRVQHLRHRPQVQRLGNRTSAMV